MNILLKQIRLLKQHNLISTGELCNILHGNTFLCHVKGTLVSETQVPQSATVNMAGTNSDNDIVCNDKVTVVMKNKSTSLLTHI
jgi:hypothetical protein